MELTIAKLKQMIEESLAKRASMVSDMNTQGMPMGTYNVSHTSDNALDQYLERGRPIKKLFHKYADQEFLDSLICVHYRDAHDITSFHKETTSKDELSCVAYRSGEKFSFGHPLGSSAVGIAVKGRITLLTNDASMMVSGPGGAYKRQYPERTKHSGANKGASVVPSIYDIISNNSAYVLDEEDWQPKDSGGVRGNEALVDNWNSFAYIVDEPGVETYLKRLVNMNEIPKRKILKSSEFAEYIMNFGA